MFEILEKKCLYLTVAEWLLLIFLSMFLLFVIAFINAGTCRHKWSDFAPILEKHENVVEVCDTDGTE